MQIPFRGSGVIYYLDREYKCLLYYKEEGGGIVLKITQRSEHGIGNYLELPLEITNLSGKLDTGFEFTLLELSRRGMSDDISMGVTVYTYFAEYLLSGIKKASSETQGFSKVNFVLANIVEWGEESIYYIGQNHDLAAKQESVSRTIYEDNHYSICYKVIGTLLPCVDFELLKEEIVLKQQGIIEISFAEEQELKEFVVIFNKLKRLFEIALLSTIDVKKIYAFSNTIKDTYGGRAYERQIDIYGRCINEVGEENIEHSARFNWITLSDLIDNSSIVYYMDKHEKLEPVIDLYIELFYLKGNTIIRIFLNIVQALETYHSRFITNDIKCFKNRIDMLANGLSPGNDDHIKKFLMASSKRIITLESRLADLIYANGEGRFDTGDINQDEFPAVVAHTRNYYIHYDERIKEGYRIFSLDELNIYKSTLFQILEYYILLELGFDSKKRWKMIKTRWGSVSRDLEILKTSRNKK